MLLGNKIRAIRDEQGILQRQLSVFCVMFCKMRLVASREVGAFDKQQLLFSVDSFDDKRLMDTLFALN